MRRFLLVLAVTFGMLVLTPSPSWACSCALATTRQHVKDAVTVAAGTVDWTATNGQIRTYEVDFDEVYKGAAAESEKLTTNAHEASCGLANLAVGARYLFFIEGKHPGAMQVTLCGGTVAYDGAAAAEVAAITGPPGDPLAAPDVERASDGSGTRPMLLGAGAAAVLLAGLVAFVVRRRVGRS